MAVLLTPELLDWIGRSAPPVTETVTRREIRRYAVATDQRLARYLDGDEAPPLFYSRFFHAIRPLDELQPDGHVADPLMPELPLQRVMAGGNETTFHRPIRPGDTLTAHRTLTDLYEREGRSGPLIFVVFRLTVTDAEQQPVVEERYVRIAR